MLCAVCNQEERVMSAIAVCQRCGAGVCRTHLYTFCYADAPAGMRGLSSPRRECVCHLCLRDMARKPAERRVAAVSDGPLPDAETLIHTVEALLNQPPGLRPARPWRQRWQTLVGWALPGLEARKARQPRALDAPAKGHAE